VALILLKGFSVKLERRWHEEAASHTLEGYLGSWWGRGLGRGAGIWKQLGFIGGAD